MLPTPSAHAAIGRIGRPAFPAPSELRGRESRAKLGRKALRDRESLSANEMRLKAETVTPPRHCEEPLRRSNPAFFFAAPKLDCFAEPVIGRRFAPTRWLAMTGDGDRSRKRPTHRA